MLRIPRDDGLRISRNPLTTTRVNRSLLHSLSSVKNGIIIKIRRLSLLVRVTTYRFGFNSSGLVREMYIQDTVRASQGMYRRRRPT